MRSGLLKKWGGVLLLGVDNFLEYDVALQCSTEQLRPEPSLREGMAITPDNSSNLLQIACAVPACRS